MNKIKDSEYQEFLEWKKFKEFKKNQTTSKSLDTKDSTNKGYKVARISNFVLTSISLALILTIFIWGMVQGNNGSTINNMTDWRIVWIITIVFSALSLGLNMLIGIESYLKPTIFKLKFKNIIIFSCIGVALLITANVLIGISFAGDKDLYLLKDSSLLISGLVIYLVYAIFDALGGFARVKTAAKVKPMKIARPKTDPSVIQHRLILTMLILSCLGLAWTLGTLGFFATDWCNPATMLNAFDGITMAFIVPLIIIAMIDYIKYKHKKPIMLVVIIALWVILALWVVCFGIQESTADDPSALIMHWTIFSLIAAVLEIAITYTSICISRRK